MMHYKRALLYFSMMGVMLYSCSGPNGGPTADRTYSDEKLIAVMIDLYTAEAAIKDVKEEIIDSLSTLYRSQIETIHDVQMQKVEKDIQIVQSDLKTYSSIHEAIQDSIVSIEKEMGTNKKSPKYTKPEGSQVKKIISKKD